MTIFGFDMSHFDAPGIGTAVAEGISFITHKAGGDANDREIGLWWDGVKGLRPKVLLGAYWVLLPGHSGADAFVARLDVTCPGWRDGPFLLQLDCEKWNGDPSTVPSKATIKACCDRLVALAPKLRPVVYAPKWVYGDSLTGLGYPLWASSYVTGSGGFRALYPGDGSSKWAAYSGQTPAILQYSSSATIGGQSTSDANAYRGTLAELQSLVAPGWETDVALDDTDIAKVAQAVSDKLLTAVPFAKGGGQASPLNDAVLNSYYPRTAGADRTLTWQNLQALQSDVTAVLTAVQTLPANLLGALVPAIVAALPAGTAVTEEQLAAAFVVALKQMAAGSA